MQTRLPGETDASNILGSKGNLLKRKKKQQKNKAIQTEYNYNLHETWLVLWIVVGTTVGTQSTDSRGELKIRKQNIGMVFGHNAAITSIFPGVHNPSWGH